MKRHTAIAAILLTTVLTCHSQAEDWPQFRGPGGQGISSEQNLPTTWSESSNVAWKAELPGFGASSPIAIADRLFLTCYSGHGTGDENSNVEDLVLHVVCLSKDGQPIWDRHIEPKMPETERVRDHGYAAPTPATDGEHLYVFFGKTGVLKFDFGGNQLWQADVGDDTHGWGCGTSPVLYKNLVIVNASVESGSLVALDKDNGQEVWRASGMNRSWNTPHLVDVGGGKRELVVSVKDQIVAYDPASGKQIWNCEGVPDYVCPSIVSQDGVVYVIGGRSSLAIAVKAGGRGDVTSSHRLWMVRSGANVVSPVINDGHLYWVSDRNKIAYCLRLEDGELIYEKRFPDQPYASTLAGDGKLYVVTRSGGTYVLAAKPEYQQLAHNKLADSSTFNASPIVAYGKLLLRSDKYLYCIAN